MEHPKHVWDSTEPDRKRVEDEKRAIRPVADPVRLPADATKSEQDADPSA